MDRYNLTERGKMSIAIGLVLVLLIIPSIIILSVASCSRSSQSNASPSPVSSQPTQTPDEDDPAISNTPPAKPTPTASPQSMEKPEPTATPEPPTPTPTPKSGNGDFGDGNGSDVPEYGPVGLNIAEGTMQFIFSPSSQESLDTETVAMLSEFLSSPKNRKGSLVKVEAPILSDDYEDALLSAVISAFSLYDISEDGLLFVSSGSAADGQSFEVALSFTAITNQK